MKKYVSLLLICFFITSHAVSQSEQLKAIAGKNAITGMQVVHVKGGKQKSYVFGNKQVGGNERVDGETIFQAASLTKVVAAYTFFKLHDKGIIALDTPLSSYFKYNRIADNQKAQAITARMVLTHRTGFLNWDGPVGRAEWYQQPLTLQFDPGAAYKYSGEGFYYLQLAMEQVSGKAFADLVNEEVFKPLEMTQSAMQWNPAYTNYSYGHYDAVKVRNLAKWSYTNAAYTLYTTGLEYTKFIQNGLLSGKQLSKATRKLMLTKAADVQKEIGVANADDKHVPAALGMRLQLNEKGTWIWHTGSNPGFRCFFIANVNTKESLVAFTNSDTGMPAFNDLMETFLQKGQTFWAYKWRNGELD